ncbi:3'-5' exoribonuclease [Moraxella bovis]|uniref:3'-5' exoribonuclease n=1 Tax=Moraxella bovis TaxID=476 RepID=A0AAX3EXI7_MORBO|nr:exonuclease domain-containing protein [Moraxella bovis]AWY20089.1 transposase [Moraxella bovis]UYZ74765.1 3'-5' exoribonuclease [Moraxella bovis]UYZ79308.1 3'-5' exoribonuclease [Moraxella bovis]UYZ80114.1 3'-5' exoribonuclease [Moraxella bovis]UYZ87788.1 3'-5' exoribonuclease [Moraxella bovis]
MKNFVVIDVETANANLSSICQIGIAVFDGETLIDEYVSLVNPQTYFDIMNVSIHGIDEADVQHAPTISEIEPIIRQYFAQGVVCSYGSFDRTALDRAIGNIPSVWLDITKVVRRTWDKFAWAGYGLASMSDYLNIELNNHHDALSDAKVAGQVLACAMRETRFDLDGIIKRANQTLTLNYENSRTKLKGNPDGEYYGETLVFTGVLSIPRSEATVLANAKGFDVSPSVNSKTNYLVKGLAEPEKLNGKDMSTKESKALTLIQKGQDIIFLSEEDFFNLIK